MRLYGIFENGEKIDEGGAKQLAKKYGVTRYAIYDANLEQSTFQGKYEVKAIGNIKGERISYRNEPKMDYTEMYMDHLDRFGNVGVAKSDNKHIDKVVKRLAQVGYDVKVKKHTWQITLDVAMEKTNSQKGRRKETTYSLERI